MLKNIQTKIIMVFVIFGIIVTTAISMLSIYHIRKIEVYETAIDEENMEEIFVRTDRAESKRGGTIAPRDERREKKSGAPARGRVSGEGYGVYSERQWDGYGERQGKRHEGGPSGPAEADGGRGDAGAAAVWGRPGEVQAFSVK